MGLLGDADAPLPVCRILPRELGLPAAKAWLLGSSDASLAVRRGGKYAGMYCDVRNFWLKMDYQLHSLSSWIRE